MRPEHFPTVPKFVLGHNAKLNPPKPRKPKPPAEPCHCNCGQLAAPGKRFLSGHNNRGKKRSAETRQKLSQGKVGQLNPMFGRRAPNYKGGYLHADGYWMISLTRDHPFARKRKMLQHRLVVEQNLRETDPRSEWLVEFDGELYLRPDVDVHHVDGDRLNNEISNLEVMTKADHTRHHQHERS